jgi:hypothetical protein
MNPKMILSLFNTFVGCFYRPKMDIVFHALVSTSQRYFNLVIPLVAKGLPSLSFPTPNGLPMELKIWMFSKMGYLKTFTKEERSDLSNPP